MKKTILLLLLAFLGCVRSTAVGAVPVTSYEECVAQGFKVLRMYPPACLGPEGKIFRASDSKVLPQPEEQKLGKNGACVDKCGDGECQEIVCQAIGCPCGESPQNCAKDCVQK